MEMLTCPDSQVNFLGLFDISIAPPLLFYAYIPIAIVLIMFGVLVLVKSRYSTESKLLCGISIASTLWIINTIVQWIGVYHSHVMLSWQLILIFELPIFFLSFYFFYHFIYHRDISFTSKALLLLLSLPIILLQTTKYNISAFDIANCEGISGYLWDYIYILEINTIFFVCYLGIKKFLIEQDDRARKIIFLLTAGTSSFLLIFFLSSILGDIFNAYEINLVGPIGMVLFIGALSYLIVEFHILKIKIIGAQALVWTLAVLIASQFFFIKNVTNQILTFITLILLMILGYFLVKGVKHEIAQKEENERLVHDLSHTSDRLLVANENLEQANERLKELDKQKTEFVSIASHQLRSPLTAIKGYSSMLLDGSFGKLDAKVTDAVGRIYESSQRLVNVIEDFLNVTRIELGKMKYEMTDINLADLIETVTKDLLSYIEKKGLKLVYEKPTDIHMVKADSGKISQVIGNLIDNASKYTEKGTITIKLAKEGKVERISVCDTGVGIDAATLPNLFEKFVRAEDAGKVNIKGTGLGLYVAKQIMLGHKGKIWAESEGVGKGSCFYVELKAK